MLFSCLVRRQAGEACRYLGFVDAVYWCGEFPLCVSQLRKMFQLFQATLL